MGAEYPTVAIFNHPESSMSDADIEALVAPLQAQVEQFAEFWHTRASLVFVPSTKLPPAHDWTLAVLDNSDQAGALGYHDLTPGGYPLGKVFAGTDKQYGEHVSVTLSHELLEMLGDPWINLSAQGPDGRFYAWETCDAVEADNLGYEIGGVLVSDFVTPAWFGNGHGRLDYMEHVSRPLELLPGGYIGVFDPGSGQGWTQITAQQEAEKELLPGVVAPSGRESAALAAAVPRVGSRRERRIRKASPASVWVASTYETA